MSLRNAQPVKFSPAGLSDALDGSNVFPGACQILQNLIPDPTTKNVWTCRPAAIEETDFTGVPDPGFISVQKVIGTRVYGMIASSTNPGHDEPFIYDLATAAFIPITGVTLANTPTSASPVGDWVPPTMDLVGPYMVVTHPGFTGGGGVFFGWIDVSDPALPAWDGGNTATNALPMPPSAVKNFAGRAWYIVNDDAAPATYFSDILDPLTVTNGDQILTYDDNIPLRALGALPLNNQLGGIIQALIVFKEANSYQVKGDYSSTTNPLSLNAMNAAVGTLCPNAICSTPRGLAFIAVDGVRVIDFKGTVSDPIGMAGMGVTVPFISIVTPSRAAAACNANTYRVSLTYAIATGDVSKEFWYDIGRAQWCGPHTFPASTIQPYSNTFIITPVGIEGSLWRSDSVQNSGSVFIENLVQLTFGYSTAVLPDNQAMNENNILESTINIAGSVDSTNYTLQAINSDDAVLATTTLSVQSTVSRWGSFTWGVDTWSVSVTGLTPIPVNWPIPVVFRKVRYYLSGFSYSGFKIGDTFIRYEQLGYLQQVAS